MVMSENATATGGIQQPPVGEVSYPPSNNATTSALQHPTPKGTNDQGDTVTNSDDGDSFFESPIAPEIGGVYAPLMRLQYQRQVENSATVPLAPRAIGGLRDQVEYEQTRSCQCQKSNCLKLYCECFSGGGYCTAYCNCRDCNNYFDGNILSRRRFDRHDAIKTCLDKNPHSFRPGLKNGHRMPARMVVEEAAPAMTTGGRSCIKKSDTLCNCTKSRCLKKYCECFRRDEYCSHGCKCQQCMNLPDNPTREKAAAAARKKTAARSSTAQAAAVSKSVAATGKTKQPQELRVEARDMVSYLITDTAYPPSYYAVPMTLPSGEPIATLGFGQGLTLKKRKADSPSGDEPQSAFERAMATEEAVLARRQVEHDANRDGAKTTNGNNNSPSNSQQKRPSLQAQMEEHWNGETQDVLGTFQAMRQELLQRQQDAGLLGHDIVLTREYSYYDLVGSAQLASVELELADVLSSVRDAQDDARERIARQAQEEKDPSVKESADVRKLSERQRANVISEAVQDTAMMKELARIVRRRALEMSERL